jgi:argonaute-like protein implicated in RNA metabolism and viral defense
MNMNIVEKIIYGDINETPLKTLGGHYRENMLYDDEQMLRLHIAATVKKMTDKIKSIIKTAEKEDKRKRDLTDQSINYNALKDIMKVINKQ